MESESECRATWADLPAELLAIISDCLEEETWGFRGACRSWRQSSPATIIPNKISRLFPHTVRGHPTAPGFENITCEYSRPRCLVANAVYHLRSETANWIVSVQESKPGKLNLSHALTRKPIPIPDGSSGGFVLYDKDSGGLTRTQLSLYHRFHSTCVCQLCRNIAHAKLVVFPDPAAADDGGNSSMALFEMAGHMFALRRCLTDHPEGQKVVQNSFAKPFLVHDFVNFNGCIYAVDYQGVVCVLDHHDATLLRLLPLPCVNKPSSRWDYRVGKRFVVSDGDLYLVFNFFYRLAVLAVPRRALFKVYKLVITNDIIMNAPTCYHLELVPHLGDRVFVLNKDCSFSVSARDLPPPNFVGEGNCILLGESPFPICSYCPQYSCIYHLGGKPKPTRIRPHDLNYSPLFHPDQLHKVAYQIKRTRKRNKVKSKVATKAYHIKRFKRAHTGVKLVT